MAKVGGKQSKTEPTLITRQLATFMPTSTDWTILPETLRNCEQQEDAVSSGYLATVDLIYRAPDLTSGISTILSSLYFPRFLHSYLTTCR